MYKGLGIGLVGVTPFIAIRMSTYDLALTHLKANLTTGSAQQRSILANGIAGGTAGIVAVSCCYPFDVMRRLMHLSGSSCQHNYTSLGDALHKVYIRKGIRGFYQGFSATLVKTIPFSVMLFVAND